MTSLIAAIAATSLLLAGQSSLPSLRALTTAPAHMPAVEAALTYCLARAGDGAASRPPAGFSRSENEAARWLYPAGRGMALQVAVTDSTSGCSLVIQDWPGATEPLAAWLRARSYRPGARPNLFERTLSDRRIVTVSHMRGTRNSILMFVSAGAPPG